MPPERRLARAAGGLYLVVAVCGGFAELFVRAKVVSINDAAATADNIRESATLFRAGFVADLVQATFFIFTAMALYLLFRHAGELVARAMVVLVAISVAIQCLNMLNQFEALQVATGHGFHDAFGAAGSDRMALLFVDMHRNGYLIAQIFFGLWLLPLGYLIIRSGYAPKALGVVLAVGGLGYVVDTFVRFLAPSVGETLSPAFVLPSAVGELSLVAWLLIVGVRRSGRDAPTSAKAQSLEGVGVA